MTNPSVKADSNQPPVFAYAKRYAYDVDGNLQYEGWCEIVGASVSTAAATWAVRKFSYTAGALVTEAWADGDSFENNIWDNRATLTYV